METQNLSFNKKTLTVIVIAALSVIFMGVIFRLNIKKTATNKQEIVKEHQKSYNQEFDAMFKKIAQEAQIPEKAMKDAKDAFKEIYIPLVSGRYENGKNDALMRWIQESNPQFDTKDYYQLYSKLQNTIEASRDKLSNKGNELMSTVADYNSYIRDPYHSWALSDTTFPIEEAKIITSSKTEEAIKTGKDDDIDLFNKK